MLFSWQNLPRPMVALSPMADMTDSAFCVTVRSVSPPTLIVFREMVSAEAIVRGNEKTLGMTAFDERERPIIQQIFGSDPETMAEAARQIVEEHQPEGIDVNMGCPVYKITHNFNGASLMKDPCRAEEIVRAIKAAVSVPVSIKIRAGWSHHDECFEFAKRLEDAGADLLTVHGRTKEQAYTGFSDWSIIRGVKERISIPVLANGDIFSAKDAKRALEVTSADGILIARGALGNPWIFSQVDELVPHGQITTVPTMNDHIVLVLAHARRHLDQYGPRGMVTFRKHLSWYTKGLTSAKDIRSALVRMNTYEELERLLAPLQTDAPLVLQRLASPQPKMYAV